MFNFLKDFFDAFMKLINNENYINFTSIVVVAISSYHIAKYNASKPNKLKIKQLQLSNVYLPLHRIFKNIPESPTKKQVLEVSNKVTNILDKNYELVFPQLHTLSKTFKSDIVKNGDFLKTLKNMKHQIDTDYELLKKSLGYPSENFYSIYVRMTFKQKATFIVSWINVFWVFAPVIIFTVFVPYLPKNTSAIIFAIALFAAFSIFMWTINKWINNLKD